MTETSITQTVCSVLSVDMDQLLRPTKLRSVCFARQVCMMLFMRKLKYTSKKAAAVFNKVNHGTALHACKVVDDTYQTDKTIRLKIDIIQNALPKSKSLHKLIPQKVDLLKATVKHTKTIVSNQKPRQYNLV